MLPIERILIVTRHAQRPDPIRSDPDPDPIRFDDVTPNPIQPLIRTGFKPDLTGFPSPASDSV